MSNNMKKNKRLKMAVTANPDLPEELIISNILIRLPYKTLCRFRCVCKHWDDTFGNPNFLASHLVHAKAHPQLITCFRFQRENHNFFLIIYNGSVKTIYKTTVYNCFVGICNGLFCFRSVSSFTIYNPGTSEFLTLPYASLKIGQVPVHMSLGFGFDPLRNEYKVVQIIKLGERCLIYTLGTDSWRDITFPKNVLKWMDRFGADFPNAGYSCNGAVNWFVSGFDKVVSFDIHTEEFMLVHAPKHAPKHPDDHLVVVDKQQQLNLVYYEQEPKLTLYMLKDPRTHLWEFTHVNLPYGDVIPPDCFVPFLQGEELFLFCVFKGLRLYNLRKRELISRIIMPPTPKGFKLGMSTFFSLAENNISLKTYLPPGVCESSYERCGKTFLLPETYRQWYPIIKGMLVGAGCK